MGKMTKKRVLFSYLAYPFTMANYFRKALERRDDVELFTVGAFSGQTIPWNGGMQIPFKYFNQVDLPLPISMLHPTWEQIRPMLPWEPDLSITVDAGWHFSTKPSCPSAIVATDPHVLDYSKQRELCDVFFNMQPSYMQEGDVLLPYAFDPKAHYPTGVDKTYDGVLVGLHYPNRNAWVNALTQRGMRINYRIGDIWDEYRDQNNLSHVGMIWSSKEDVIARVFEVMAMKLVPVMNRLSGLSSLGFQEWKHYIGFSSLDEAVEKVLWARQHEETSRSIAETACKFVHDQKMTWDNRVSEIFTKFA